MYPRYSFIRRSGDLVIIKIFIIIYQEVFPIPLDPFCITLDCQLYIDPSSISCTSLGRLVLHTDRAFDEMHGFFMPIFRCGSWLRGNELDQFVYMFRENYGPSSPGKICIHLNLN